MRSICLTTHSRWYWQASMAEITDEPAPHLLIDHAEWDSFFKELGRESERATAILAAAWIDDLLRRRLTQLFSSGNKEARAQIFAPSGPFATFSAKIDAAFCIGWLDADVHHDLHVIRKVRNSFAHQVHGLSMESPQIRCLTESFRVPRRDYYDWGKLKCAATDDGNGIVFYTDTPAEMIGEPLVIPSFFTFRWAASGVIAYLAANLGVGIAVPDDFTFDVYEDTEDT
jgi:hypothetical protein